MIVKKQEKSLFFSILNLGEHDFFFITKRPDEISKFPKNGSFETPILKLAVYPLNIHNFNFNGQLSSDRLYINTKT